LKDKHWRGFSGIFALEVAPVLICLCQVNAVCPSGAQDLAREIIRDRYNQSAFPYPFPQ
jgi:hypothetical protein